MMDKYNLNIILGPVFLIICLGLIFELSKEDENFGEKVKIALRDSGNQLLLTASDSSSLILPILEIEESKYQLSFENKFSFEPNKLVAIIDSSLKESSLPEPYRVEVKRCSDQEVGYSYEIQGNLGSDIIPCSGREMPSDCYLIELKFLNKNTSYLPWIIISLFGLFISMLIYNVFLKKKPNPIVNNDKRGCFMIGNIKFYPLEFKLITPSEELSLSRKECELLSIFIAAPNQIITREELIKKVWEDNGVIVGRSLDTYISKLRKKLKIDESIQITNIHGVGYKLITE